MTMKNETFPTQRKTHGVHVCVLGGIGAGKSTLANAIGEVWDDCEVLREPASITNPYLADYYADPEQNAFAMQIFLLNKRFEQQLIAQDRAIAGRNVVQDSSIFSDSCFVSKLVKDGTMRQVDANTYFDLFTNMTRFALYPTAVVYLDTPIDVQIKRIVKRMEEKEGRKCECAITADYLTALQLEYERLLTGLGQYTRLIRLPWGEPKTMEEIKATARSLYDYILAGKMYSPIDCFLGV